MLIRAIQSVREQSLTDWELIVVDDGSSDGTEALVAEIADARVRYIRTEHQGVAAARNRGICLARHPWLAFLDSDDSWRPRKLERQLAESEDSPYCKIIYTDETWIRKGARVNQKKIHRKYGGWIFHRCLPLCIISPSSVLIHRDLLEAEGVFDEALPVCEDYELWLRLTARHPVRFLHEPLIVKTGGHPDQLSRKYWGMDRFRVRALMKTFASGRLTEQQKCWTAAEIVHKTIILAKGFQNRGKTGEAEAFRGMSREWENRQHRGSFLAPGLQG